MDQHVKNIRQYPSWEKAWLRVFEKGSEHVYVILNENPFYGDLIVRFQIGETAAHTGVLYETPVPGYQYVEFQENASLCGARAFERGSITYEFLWKPLGLDPDNPPVHKVAGWDPLFTGFREFSERMAEKGWTLLPSR